MSKKVIVLGGGVAGLSAAHELLERGYDVEVLERNPTVGGKARSLMVPGTKLPGEHGFRFFGRFYWHLIDTMKRIPYPIPGDGETVFDRLTDTHETGFARDHRDVVRMPLVAPRNPIEVLEQLWNYATLARTNFGLSKEDMMFFFDKMSFVLFSCRTRRLDELSCQSWWNYIEAGPRSEGYQIAFARSIHSLVAANPVRVNAFTIGNCAAAGLLGVGLRDTRFDGRWDMVGRSFDRILDGTSTEAWLEPWHRFMGTRIRTDTIVRRILSDRTRVTGVEVETEGDAGRKTKIVQGDYYVCALPVENVTPLLNDDLLAADPSLQVLRKIEGSVGWMVGAQFFLKRRLTPPRSIGGHVLHATSPWALTSIHQAQFWKRVDFPALSDGEVKDCLSVCISDWDTKDRRNGRSAHESTKAQILEEVWTQLCESFRDQGAPVLRPEDLHTRFLDPAVLFENGEGLPPTGNRERLLLNEIKIQRKRPQAQTGIPNFFLASDYVATFTDLATMEGANEAARSAVNALLVADNSTEDPCRIRQVHEPEVLAIPREMDRIRHDAKLSFELPEALAARLAELLDALEK